MDRRTTPAFLAALLALWTTFGAGETARVAAETHLGSSRPCIYDHSALRSPANTCRPVARSYPAHIKGSVRHAIYDGALTFGVPYATMLKLAKCESGLNPRATSGRYFGLFQFLPATFKRGAKLMLRETGVRAKSYWNARDSSYVTGYLFAVGSAKGWTCTNAIPTG